MVSRSVSILAVAAVALFGTISAVTVNEPCGDRSGLSGFDLLPVSPVPLLVYWDIKCILIS